VTLIVDAIDAHEVAAEIAALPGVDPRAKSSPIGLDAPSGSSTIVIEPGAASKLGEAARARWPNAARAWLISDATVGPLHAASLASTLTTAGFDVRSHEVPPGEKSKSLAGAERLYDWLLAGGIERGDIVVALGGGMIGDLAGFVAATCLRGVGLIQVPTSLLAMVDSSVGGKTGINHRAGKNLIGAFYQPPLVVIDPTFLRTLPPRELTSGWAEIVKHAVIQVSTPGGERGDLLRFMERNASRLVAIDEPAASYLIRRNVALKAAVVVADERERGLRAILNFGHTLGHAIEAAEYRYLHGEAIAVGLRAATRIGETCGTCDGETVRRLDALLDRFGLPATVLASPERVLDLLGSDKKRSFGRQQWVLPLTGGGVVPRNDVSTDAIRAALNAVIEPAS
jgi:3-dehydroquinate synthase